MVALVAAVVLAREGSLTVTVTVTVTVIVTVAVSVTGGNAVAPGWEVQVAEPVLVTSVSSTS